MTGRLGRARAVLRSRRTCWGSKRWRRDTSSTVSRAPSVRAWPSWSRWARSSRRRAETRVSVSWSWSSSVRAWSAVRVQAGRGGGSVGRCSGCSITAVTPMKLDAASDRNRAGCPYPQGISLTANTGGRRRTILGENVAALDGRARSPRPELQDRAAGLERGDVDVDVGGLDVPGSANPAAQWRRLIVEGGEIQLVPCNPLHDELPDLPLPSEPDAVAGPDLDLTGAVLACSQVAAVRGPRRLR